MREGNGGEKISNLDVLLWIRLKVWKWIVFWENDVLIFSRIIVNVKYYLVLL